MIEVERIRRDFRENRRGLTAVVRICLGEECGKMSSIPMEEDILFTQNIGKVFII